MAREVIVKTWCDIHLEQDEHVEGVELPPLKLPEVPGNKPRLIAFCEVHRKELYDPLVEALSRFGQPFNPEGDASAPRRARQVVQASEPGANVCPQCGHTSPTRSALMSHIRSAHDTTLAELEGGELPYACPECSFKAPNPQGLGAHRRAKHGVKGANARDRSPGYQHKDEGQEALA